MFTFVWSLAVCGLVFWGTRGLGIPWQLHLAIALFLLGPAIARLFRPQPTRKGRR